MLSNKSIFFKMQKEYILSIIFQFPVQEVEEVSSKTAFLSRLKKNWYEKKQERNKNQW